MTVVQVTLQIQCNNHHDAFNKLLLAGVATPASTYALARSRDTLGSVTPEQLLEFVDSYKWHPSSAGLQLARKTLVSAFVKRTNTLSAGGRVVTDPKVYVMSRGLAGEYTVHCMADGSYTGFGCLLQLYLVPWGAGCGEVASLPSLTGTLVARVSQVAFM